MNKRVEHDLLTYLTDGFPSLSGVAAKYVITDGLLHKVGRGVVRTYSPFSEASLPTALARVSTKEIGPLEFACQFGELGYSQLVRTSLLPTFSACLPKSEKWKSANMAYRSYRDAVIEASRELPEGDPVEWFLAQSRTVALCIEFIGLLGERDELAIQESAEGITRGPYAVRDRLINLPLKEWRRSLQEGGSASATIRQQLCYLITENIAGVRREFITDPFVSRAESCFLSRATIEAVYWQLADKMEARMVRRCSECRRFFVARDKRQQYCPPLPGSARSRCSSRLNTTNHRGRQA